MIYNITKIMSNIKVSETELVKEQIAENDNKL